MRVTEGKDIEKTPEDDYSLFYAAATDSFYAAYVATFGLLPEPPLELNAHFEEGGKYYRVYYAVTAHEASDDEPEVPEDSDQFDIEITKMVFYDSKEEMDTEQAFEESKREMSPGTREGWDRFIDYN